MTLRNITCYDYRWFDNMLLILTEDGKQLNIYCPSACIYRDGDSRFYCYDENISQRVGKAIECLEYDPDETYGLQCDGTAECIWYSDTKENHGTDYRKNFARWMSASCNCNYARPPIDYWDRYNDRELVDKAMNTVAWGGLAEAFSAVAKNISDAQRHEEE